MAQGKQRKQGEEFKNYRDLLVWQNAYSLIKKGLRILREVKKDFVWVGHCQSVSKSTLLLPVKYRGAVAQSHCGRNFAPYLEFGGCRGQQERRKDWSYASHTFYALHDER